ncbi:PREDICTED: odorant receptor 49b-like, partial [Wasmannia auropunctata]|uniref:odorant receptor 49b-like n=1 Tax=Wasmannia auropunctata TaxID=64793 RepID=UPI0005EF9AD1
IGQNVTDHCDLLFATAYEAKWYKTPVHIQKFILFLLIKGNKPFGLKVGGLFIASLQCFSMLINAALSYFIAIYSMR